MNNGNEIMMNETIDYNVDRKMKEKGSRVPSLIQIHDALASPSRHTSRSKMWEIETRGCGRPKRAV